ncbi:SRPBCC family protein [Streptomyces torulosus]|uniref:SRPBCC family protein n=1 Tax=Streptomyces torulosus TaxID=68276 RepID=UPI0006EBB209|nr:SRPBCC family protein [Streptomyces torulosus]
MTVQQRSFLGRALYVGPSLRTLHEQYAKHGTVDAGAPVLASCEVTVRAPSSEVWELLADIARWPSWVPGVRQAHLDGDLAPDVPFRWVLNGMRVKSTLAVVRPGSELSWTGTLAGTRGVHRFLLEPARGATRVRSEESIGGPLAGLLYSSDKLQAVLADWTAALKSQAEKTGSTR